MPAQPGSSDGTAARREGAPLRAAVLGLVVGAAGGGFGALLDWLAVRGEIARHLPDGSLRVLAFLVCLYGGALGAAGLLVGLLLWALLRWTALGPLSASAPLGAPPAEEGRGREAPGVPYRAVLLAALLAAAALGAALYGPTLVGLLRFHHRVLIALLVGAGAAALLLPAAALALLLAAALARLPLIAGSKRVPPRPPGAPAAYAAGAAAALPLFAGAVAALLLYLQGHPRMNAPLRALNLALATPGLALAAALLGHLLGRGLARRLGPRLGRWAWSLPGTLAAALLTLAAPAAVLAAAYWPTLRILDLRPLTTGALAGVAALGLALILGPRGWGQRALLLALLPLLWSGTLVLGHGDRVRKAALSQAPIAGPLTRGLHALFDLDRDGYPSRWIVGGSDCNDLDATMHPAAFDWPGDGADQNCNGHLAQLPAAEPPAWPAPPPGLPARPNLVLITIDALRADHVSAYGYGRPTTPALDALAREGTLFESAWAHAPSTRYSIPAILTGRYPSTIAWGSPAHHWPPEVLPENRLLAEELRQRGYYTLALLSYHYFEPSWGLAQGFDDYDVHLMTLHSMGGDPAATSGSSARELADLALRKLAALPPEREPFFLWVHFYDPHFRYELHEGVPRFGTGQREEDLYDNEIRYTDGHIGRLLDALRARPSWPRTAVLVTADHGEGFGEHGIPPDRRHGYHLYANQTRVPLVLRAPALPPRRVASPVGHVDIAPTLLQLAGVSAAEQPQLLGRPLLALAGGAEEEERQVFQEVMYEGPTVRKALVTRRWHYVRNVIPDGTTELYDLERDPGEERDLQGSPALRAVEADLSLRLAAWMDQSALPPEFARRVAGNVSASPLTASRPLGAVIGGMLEVVGADVRTPEVRPGGTAEVALVLRARRRVPPGWRLFTHLTTPGGRFLNADHDPVEGLLPLQQLRPEQYVRDVVRIPIPASWPPGPATVELGLFRGGERAAVEGPAGVADPGRRLVRAATLEVR